ncbi:cytochrome c-type biogenesis protein CcmH [Marinobacter sp. NP-4(2019)]|uniref:cytochrome c-type biogenesis protein n=1 Tax=Marinobacter sp. NP-4(2019) TaxID=2488665 RepID=UPI000FC3DB47|nr:cytochrome c-type biogenesis protein [Marinobacter sp. NP-4(2019)]AZT84393.1 cytochrome c-type biogenesis protein CcmH [Marinobacter sp. NP-4(2019)]
MRPLIALIVLAALLPLQVSADEANVEGFDSLQEEQRYRDLTAELRCPKCQNQNIADSNAPIAKDMRDRVYQMMQDGASNEEIVGDLVGRFGEFVRYKPEVDRRTLLLWATPAIAVGIGLLAVASIIVRSRCRNGQKTVLTPEEQARVDRLLADKERE